MKIKPSIEECSNIILGAYGSSSFYNTFDKVLYGNDGGFIDFPINNLKSEQICSLITKIQSHWNKQNSKDFNIYANNNVNIINALLRRPETNYNEFIMSINIKGIKNTKISKILHILKPNIFPMLDPFQGKFLIENYNKNSREDLIEAIESFRKHWNNKDNYQKTKKIEEKLVNSYGIKISSLRVFELLIWIQTQLSIKDINKTIIEKSI